MSDLPDSWFLRVDAPSVELIIAGLTKLDTPEALRIRDLIVMGNIAREERWT